MASDNGDEGFGPEASFWFDFTLQFEQTILTILPTGLFIAAAPLYLWSCSQKPVASRPGRLLWTKMAAAVVLLGVEIASLVSFARTPAIRTDTALAAASLSCFASLNIAALIFVEHRHALRSTSLFTLYIMLSLILDAVKSRSYFIRHNLDALGSLSAVAGAIKLLIVILEEVPRRHLLIDVQLRSTAGKEATGGFLYRTFLGWLSSLFARGFSRVLSIKDLETLSPELSSRYLFKSFNAIWIKGHHGRPSSRLATACFHTLKWPFFAVVLPRILYSGFSFAQPFLLQRVLVVVADEDASSSDKLGLLAATFIVFLGRAISRKMYMHANYSLVTMTRGVMISAMVKKQLRLKPAEAKKSAIASLMATDIDGIASGIPEIHALWSYILDAGLGLYVLYRFINVACVVILGPFIFSIFYGIWIGNWSGKALRAWNANIQIRVSKTADVLAQLIPIKMTGLSPAITNYVQNLRITEMEYAKRFRTCTSATIAGLIANDSLTPVIVLVAAVCWTTFPGGFQASNAFPILSAVSLLQKPLAALMGSFSKMAPMWTCFNRIQAFLELPEWADTRELVPVSNTEADCEKRPDATPIIELENAWITPVGSSNSILQSVNLKIIPSTILALLGPVSCGKSSFMETIIGEGNILHGKVKVACRNIAYCAQTPYLSNVSIRDNIVGPGVFEQKLYWAVVKACELLDDLNQLSAGDQTMVGSDGINLSVGQRARVALARAVYARMKILIIDDIFSSLDQVTARAILKQLLGPAGLLRQWRTTVLIATHLSVVLDVADEVLIFKDKRVTQRKDFDTPEIKRELITAMGTSKQMSKAFKETEAEAGRQEWQQTQEKAAPTTDKDHSAEDTIRTRGEFGLYKFYFRAMKKLQFFLWGVVMMFMAVIDMFPPGYVRIWVEKGPRNKKWLIGYALLGVANAVIGFFAQRLFYIHLLPHSGEFLHMILLQATMGATYTFISGVDSGYLLNRYSQDMHSVVQSLPGALFRFVFMMFSILVSLTFVLAGASYAALVLPFLGTAIYLIQKYYLRTSRQLRYLDLETQTPLLVSFKEASNGLQHIRSYGWTDDHFDRCMTLLDEAQQAYYQMFCIQVWLTMVLDLTVTGIALIVVGIALYVRNSTSSAAIGLAYLLLIDFGNSLTLFVQRWTEMETSLGSISRLRSFVEDTPQERDSPSASNPAYWRNKGKIRFKNVTAGYNSDSVLKDISFEVKAGDKVQITGRSGSGKSSILVTLLNFLEYSGSIYIDGINIKAIPRQQLRSRITTITQTPVVLAGSIRDNLIPFADKGSKLFDSFLKRTLRQLGLWQTVELKGGLDADLKKSGLSVAEQQLICIARAILHHEQMETKIVLMDEATSSLSLASTLELQRVIKDAFQDCTVINIAHWESTLDSPDLNVILDNGKLVSAERTEPESEDSDAAERREEEEQQIFLECERLYEKEEAEQVEILEREKALEASRKAIGYYDDTGPLPSFALIADVGKQAALEEMANQEQSSPEPVLPGAQSGELQDSDLASRTPVRQFTGTGTGMQSPAFNLDTDITQFSMNMTALKGKQTEVRTSKPVLMRPLPVWRPPPTNSQAVASSRAQQAARESIEDTQPNRSTPAPSTIIADSKPSFQHRMESRKRDKPPIRAFGQEQVAQLTLESGTAASSTREEPAGPALAPDATSSTIMPEVAQPPFAYRTSNSPPSPSSTVRAYGSSSSHDSPPRPTEPGTNH